MKSRPLSASYTAEVLLDANSPGSSKTFRDESDVFPLSKSKFMYLVDVILFPIERAEATVDCNP